MYTILPGAEVRLQDDYGAMLINTGSPDKPIPRYILAIRGSRTLVDTRSIEMFRVGLSQIKKGSQVFIYDSCSVPRWAGLSDKQKNDFSDAIKEAGLIVPENQPERFTCYCDAWEREKDRKALERIREAEQGGADRPATDPASKPEGGEKPQPESKPAPR